MRSRTARRIILGLAIAGTVAAIFTGPLLALRWMEGSVPLSPWTPGSAANSKEITQTIELPRESYAFTWPARDGSRPAPTLRMRAAPTDWHGWWTLDPATRQLALAGDTPQEVAFDVMVPDGEAITPDTMGTLCDAHPATPGACRIGHARVRLLRDDTDADRLDIVRGMRAPDEASRRSADGATLPVRHAFWTKTDTSDGRRTFLGWDCTGPATSPPLPDVGTASPAVLYRCHAPAGWLERNLPDVAGLEHPAVYHACDAAGRCEMFFPFHGRLAVLDFDTLPPGRDVETTRLRLFLAAWQMLNRMHVDALYPRGAVAELPAAQAQLAACRDVAAAADKGGPARGAELSPAERHRVDILALTCRRAAEIAARSAGSANGEAVTILAEALPALARLTTPAPHEDALYEAWLNAAKGSAGDDPVTRLAGALAGFLGRAHPIAPDQPGFAAREAEIQRARALVAGGGDGLPDDLRERLVESLVRQYRFSHRENDTIAILEEHVGGLARVHGASHPLVARPLARLGVAQSEHDRLIGLRRTAEQLLELWRSKGATADAPMPDDWTAALEAETGFALVQFQRTIARRDGSAAAAGVIPSVIARMTQRLGASHPYVRAAQSGQTEPPTMAAPSVTSPPAPASAR